VRGEGPTAPAPRGPPQVRGAGDDRLPRPADRFGQIWSAGSVFSAPRRPAMFHPTGFRSCDELRTHEGAGLGAISQWTNHQMEKGADDMSKRMTLSAMRESTACRALTAEEMATTRGGIGGGRPGRDCFDVGTTGICCADGLWVCCGSTSNGPDSDFCFPRVV
jgi:hypothetical protein